MPLFSTHCTTWYRYGPYKTYTFVLCRRRVYMYYLSICLLMILLLHLSPQPSQYPCIPQSGGCSDCAFAGMIERLWLPPSGIATLALCSVLFFCVCSCATRARNSHRALASVAACTCSFLWSSAMMLVYVAPQSVRPVLLLKTALAFAYRGQCAITCSLVSVLSRHWWCVHFPLWLV